MLRLEKREFVSNLEQIYNVSSSIIVAHYQGLTVSQMTALRKKLRENGAEFKVVKNTLSKIAANNSGIQSICNLFSGPTAIAYSSDPVAAAKVVVDFSKINENLKVVGGFVDGQILSASLVNDLAKLPSMDELRSKLIAILQAPSTKVARVLQTPASNIARVLQAYADKNC